MQDNLENGKLDPSEDVRRPCKKNFPSVLSCIRKRTREGCDHGSEIGTVYSGRNNKGPFSLRKRKGSDRRGSCEKDFA